MSDIQDLLLLNFQKCDYSVSTSSKSARKKNTSNAFFKNCCKRISCFCLVAPAPTAVASNAAIDLRTATSCASLNEAYIHSTVEKNL